VQDPPRLAGERFSFPLAGPVEIDRHRIVELGRVSTPDQRRYQKHLLPIALRVDPAHPVGCRHTVDLARCPRLSHVLAALEQVDVADAPLGTRFEPVRQDRFGNSVAVDIPTSGVQWPRHICRQHMPVPRGMLILVPSEFRGPLVDGDHVPPPVAVQVGGDKLIAELQIAGEHVLTETRQVLGTEADAGPEPDLAGASQPLPPWSPTVPLHIDHLHFLRLRPCRAGREDARGDLSAHDLRATLVRHSG